MNAASTIPVFLSLSLCDLDAKGKCVAKLWESIGAPVIHEFQMSFRVSITNDFRRSERPKNKQQLLSLSLSVSDKYQVMMTEIKRANNEAGNRKKRCYIVLCLVEKMTS